VSQNMTRWQRLMGFIRPQRGLVVQAAFCLMTMACIQLSMPWAIKVVIDDVMTSNENMGLLTAILVGLLLLYALREVLFHVSQYLIGYATLHVVFDLRRALFRHLQRMSLRFYNERRTGQIVSRVINDVGSIAQLMQQGASAVVTNLFMLAACLAIIFVIRWDLALVSCFVVPMYAWNFYHYRSQIREASHDVRKKMAVITGNLTENISGVKVVKSFTGEGRQDQAFVQDMKEHFGLGMRLRMITVKCSWIADYLRIIGTVLAIGYGTHLVVQKVMTIGEFVAFYTYLGMLYMPIIQLVTFATTIMGAVAGIDRVFEIMEQAPDAEETSGKIVPERIEGRVAFDNVSLSYDGKRPALREVSFEVEPGQAVALVGPSGSGKTSVANLIARFYLPSGGRVLVDGIDLIDLEVKHFRRQLGLVLQENFLFSGSVIDNIRYGRPDATVEQVIEAARQANAEEFILDLPQRYDTEVGENGESLSGGQRQRIAIARAILKDPRLLILDEATSALDASSEELVQQALERLMKGRTTFIIAHRLSTIRNADKILTIVSGELAQVGTHEELLAQEGPYRELYWPQIREAKQLLSLAG
jgi:ATP-binding cassette, subfamily B, bacterial MsbA